MRAAAVAQARGNIHNFYSTQRNVLYAGWNNAFKNVSSTRMNISRVKLKTGFPPLTCLITLLQAYNQIVIPLLRGMLYRVKI